VRTTRKSTRVGTTAKTLRPSSWRIASGRTSPGLGMESVMLHRITLQSAISTLGIVVRKHATEMAVEVGRGRLLSTANTRLCWGWAIAPSATQSTLEMVGVMVQTTQLTSPPRASLMVVIAASTAAVDPFVGRTGLTFARIKPWQTRRTLHKVPRRAQQSVLQCRPQQVRQRVLQKALRRALQRCSQ
jgi:hypothetical protein